MAKKSLMKMNLHNIKLVMKLIIYNTALISMERTTDNLELFRTLVQAIFLHKKLEVQTEAVLHHISTTNNKFKEDYVKM